MPKLRREVICPRPIHRPPSTPTIVYSLLVGLGVVVALETYALHVVESYASQPAITTR